MSELKISRREFAKGAAFLGSTALLAAGFATLEGREDNTSRAAQEARGGYPLSKPENIIYSVCLQCNTGCGIKVKLWDGVVAKIDGNPYSPWTMWPHLPYNTDLKQAAKIDTPICPKGQAGIQTAYDPYRITRVLKRKPGTKRGEGQWITIPFDQAVDEIVNGGDLFGEGPVTGLKELYALRDPDLATAMAAEVKKILAEKDPAKKKALVEDFKAKFKDSLGLLIDPDHPDLGPKNNQFYFLWGRLKGGREDLVVRFVKDAFGSVNAHGHTTVCQGSLYFTGKAMSSKWNPATGSFDWGDKFYWQGDIGNSEFIIFVGANMFEGNYGPPLRVPKITEGISDGSLKYAVLDPRFSKAASKAWRWVPLKPGTDGAFAMGMIRWILENKRYNADYLSIANQAAATASGEPNYSNASWLVKITNGQPGKFVRASELGLVSKATEKDKDGKDVTVYTAEDGQKFPFDPLVVMVNGKPVPFDPGDPKAMPVRGDLLVSATVAGVQVKSALQLLLESASKYTVAQWAEICGVSEEDIVVLAREFTSHGRRAVADIHRGPSQHTNGFYNNMAWNVVNLLIGNFDQKGGLIKATTYNRNGAAKGQPFPIGNLWGGKKMVPFGIDAIRTNTAYESSTLFSGYPAKRPWFPIATDVYQEAAPSIGDAYPYPIKVLMLYMNGMAYSLPAAHTVIDVLSDPKKIPLVISCDILVGVTSRYADYIFPDVSYLERWEFHGSHPSVPWKVENVRQPAVSMPNWPKVKVFGEEIPLSFEALVLAIAERLGLPGFGPNGFGQGLPFTRPEHLYLKQVANIAFGEKEDGSDAVPEANDEELRIFLESRRHLPKEVFDPATWKAAIGNDEKMWRRVVYVLNRGGRYQDFAKGYKGDQVANPYGRLVNIYQEKTATSINTMTGKPFVGYPTYVPPAMSSLGEPVADEGYDLHLITYREITMTKSRTIVDYWLLGVLGEGFVLINKADADRLGLRPGDRVKIVSASNPQGEWDLKDGTRLPMVGKVKVVQGIRPGVVAFPLGFGHFATGAVDIVVDGQVIKGDPRRAAALHGNAAMRVDPHLKNVTLSDLVGGSAVFYDTKVKLVKV
jgi:anaerobic selenocysteine-containing dehydrogenase